MLIIFQALSVLMRVLACDRIVRERRVAGSARSAETWLFYQLENASTSAARVFKSEVTCSSSRALRRESVVERRLTMFHIAKIYVHLAWSGCKLIYDLTVTHYPQFRGTQRNDGRSVTSRINHARCRRRNDRENVPDSWRRCQRIPPGILSFLIHQQARERQLCVEIRPLVDWFCHFCFYLMSCTI